MTKRVHGVKRVSYVANVGPITALVVDVVRQTPHVIRRDVGRILPSGTMWAGLPWYA